MAHKAEFNYMPYEQDISKPKWFRKLKIKERHEQNRQVETGGAKL